MRKRSANAGVLLVGLLGWLVGTGGGSGCGQAGPEERRVTGPQSIIARWGDESVRVRLLQSPRALRIRGALRTGACVAMGKDIEVEVAPPTSELHLSSAVTPVLTPRGQAVPLRLRVQHRQSGGDWETFAELEAETSTRTWRDFVVELPGAPTPARHLRFGTHPVDHAPEGRVCYGALQFAGPVQDAAVAQPNVILFSFDTLGAPYLGSFGGPQGISPHLDALLDQSFQYRRAFSNSQNTLVSHSSLFSSLLPARHKRYTRVAVSQKKAPPLASLVGEFAARGYHTAAFTENAYVGTAFGFGAGFDQYDDGHSDEPGTFGNLPNTLTKADRWIDTFAARTPFFMFVHTYEVHSPYQPRDEAARNFASSLAPGALSEIDWPRVLIERGRAHNKGKDQLTERDFDRYRALYSGEIHYLDAQLRGFVDALEARGVLRDTLLVFTSDHGELFGEHGAYGHGWGPHNRAFHVPLAFYWPGRIEPGVSDEAVMLVDVLPTVFDLVGIDVPGSVDGRSLASAIRREATLPASRPAISEIADETDTCTPTSSGRCAGFLTVVQTDRFKLVRANNGKHRALYDLSTDLDELVDVSAAHPDVLASLEAEALEYDALRGRRVASPPPSDPAAAGPEEEIDAETLRRLEALGYVR